MVSCVYYINFFKFSRHKTVVRFFFQNNYVSSFKKNFFTSFYLMCFFVRFAQLACMSLKIDLSLVFLFSKLYNFKFFFKMLNKERLRKNWNYYSVNFVGILHNFGGITFLNKQFFEDGRVGLQFFFFGVNAAIMVCFGCFFIFEIFNLLKVKAHNDLVVFDKKSKTV